MLTEHVFNFPVSERAASLTGILTDLKQVKAYCERLIQRYSGPHLKKSPFDIVGFNTPLDFLEWEALSAAACVKYARCFVSGVRSSLDPKLLQADDELRMTHDFVLELRNKHIGHSVNSFEVNSITIQIASTMTFSEEIELVLPRHERSGGFSIDYPARLVKLVEWWLSQTSEGLHAEIEKVRLAARSMGLASIRALPELQSTHHNERLKSISKRRHRP
jgi:hypothetical protein